LCWTYLDQDELLENDILAIFPHKRAPNDRSHCFGIIKSADSSTNKYKIEVMLQREQPSHSGMFLTLRQQPKLNIIRIDSILSFLRELDAIALLGKHHLLPCILRGEFAPMRELAAVERATIVSHAQQFKQLNESQKQALKLVHRSTSHAVFILLDKHCILIHS
jgi:hypothetical protein